MFNENRKYITATDLQEYWYCPRFIYYMYVTRIRQYEEKRVKVQIGREVHKAKALEKDYLRKSLGVVKQEKEMYLSDENLGICGIIDEILHIEDGSIVTLEYKFAENKYKFRTQFYQAVYYSLLIDSNYKTNMTKCYFVYTRSGSKLVKYDIKPKHKEYILDCIKEFKKIAHEGFYPKRTKYQRQCLDCTYNKICDKY